MLIFKFLKFSALVLALVLHKFLVDYQNNSNVLQSLSILALGLACAAPIAKAHPWHRLHLGAIWWVALLVKGLVSVGRRSPRNLLISRSRTTRRMVPMADASCSAVL